MSSTPFKAFVSSTYEDLKAHRAQVIRSLRKAGIFVDPMEDWTADSDEPKSFSQERLAGCDFCVLLVALRRGFIPAGEKQSITQLEYQAALDQEIDVFVYLLDENAPWPHRFVELDKDPALSEWRRTLETRHGRESFGLEPTSIDVAPAVTRWVDKQSRKSAKVGEDWVQLISGLLDLPKNQPSTWVVAGELLPHALEAAKRVYRAGLSNSPSGGQITAPELSQPLKNVVAGAREYLTESRAMFDRTCFVLMPFGVKSVDGRVVDFDAIYHEIFEPAIAAVRVSDAENAALIPRRVDQVVLGGSLDEDVFRYLEYSRLVLADISAVNANVFYELGVRHHARASGTVIVRQADAMVPFDVSRIRTIVYAWDRPDHASQSRMLIQRVLEEALRSETVDSPQHQS